MGAAVGVNSRELSSPVVNKGKIYFSNSALLRGFWSPIVKDSNGSASLAAIHKFLSSTNPEYSVALYAGPFMGPFATSKFCLREAFKSSVNRDGSDLASMMLLETELPIFLKHLFFFHRLYALYGDGAKCDAEMPYEEFKEMYEDLSDDVVDENNVRNAYASLGARPTHGIFAGTMSDMLFSVRMVSASQAEAIFGQHQEAWNQLAMRLPPPGGVSAADGYRDDGVISVSWHGVTSCEEWVGALQSLAPAHFVAILDQIKCHRCCFAACVDDPNLFMTVLWLRDHGELYEQFMKEQMNDDGIFQMALEDELIFPPFQNVQFDNDHHVGWGTTILPGDMLSMTYFNVRNYKKFANSYKDFQAGTARDSHLLQTFFGKQSAGGDGPGVIEHYTSDGWSSAGIHRAEEFYSRPNDSFTVSSKVRRVVGEVVASFEEGEWLEKR